MRGAFWCWRWAGGLGVVLGGPGLGLRRFRAPELGHVVADEPLPRIPRRVIVAGHLSIFRCVLDGCSSEHGVGDFHDLRGGRAHHFLGAYK